MAASPGLSIDNRAARLAALPRVHRGRAIMDSNLNEAILRDRYGPQSALVERKVMPRLDRHARAFIALSPFLILATAGASGGADASPRGDPPGFVRVLDDQTLLIPDRPGNNRLDTYSNLLAAPGIGILFMVPGIDETLRVNGRGQIALDDPRLEDSAINGKPPRGGLLIEVEQVFFHCGKPLKRSKLWDPAAQIPRASFPSLGRILAEQTRIVTAEEAEINLEAAYRTRLY